MSNDAYVIVGAGHAARRAAQTLRQRDAAVPIVVLGEETAHPYDRPALSKEALLSADAEHKLFVLDACWYAQQGIELRLGVRVESIDRQAQCVHLADGSTLSYHRLLLATGSRVRHYPGPVDPGVNLHYLRTLADTRALRGQLTHGTRVAVLGGGFIGLEVAASARARGCQVTVLEAAPGLLLRALPDVVGQFVRGLHRSHDVDVRLGTAVTAIRRAGDGSIALECAHGELAADVVVVGIGVVPNVELAQAAGLAVDNGIVVDAACRTSDPAIFAAGEVTCHPDAASGTPKRIESWQVAENQPPVAAANMLGGQETYGEIPWLWSDQYDCNIQMLGAFDAADTLVTRGNPSSGAFTVFGLRMQEGAALGRMVAAAAVNSGRDIAVCRRLMQAGKPVDPLVLADCDTVLRKLLA